MNTPVFKPKLLQTLRSYNKQKFAADVMAGVIVGIVALPLAIAFAIASGVSPEKGIITAIVAGFMISVFGGSKVQIGGPTGAFIIIIYGIIQQYGIQGLTIATLMAGVFLVLFGLLRLGTIIKYIPYPIVVGFTSGIAVTIFTTQIKDLFGLTMQSVPSDFIEKWIAYAHDFPTLDPWSTAVGVLSIAIIAATPKFSKKIPGSLVAIILMTTLALVAKNHFGITTIETIGDRFSINASLPETELPSMSWETIKMLVSPALTIAILGAIESLLSATVADGVIGDHHDSNTELIGQGLANLAAPIFGGIPATGAIARTMTNINNGGRTPVAGIVHAVVLLLIFLFLMPLAQYIPMACLAGVLVVVSYGMCGWRSFLMLMKNPKSDVSVLLITFFLTIIFDLTVAIEVGLIIACLLFMKRMSETTDVKVIMNEIAPEDETDVKLENNEHLQIPAGVEVYEINGPYFFGAGNRFEEIMANFGDRPKVRIIRMRKVPFVDSTGIHNLTNLCLMSQKEGIQIVLSGVNDKVHKTLAHAGFYSLIGEDNICSHINIALAKARDIVLRNAVITTDSRDCPEGSVFIALKGGSFDGNKFAAAALEKGCSYAVVDEKEYAVDDRYILVDDGLKALKRLAREHRRQFDIPVIGITGTNGKTTTKELVAAVLEKKYNVLYTQGNFNNDIGVPKTLLRLTAEHEIAVIEMGASHPGDIKTLVETAEPTCGLITNVGRAHLEGFGSFEGVVKTKGELYDYLRQKRGAKVFIDAGNEHLLGISDGLDLVRYGVDGDNLDVQGRVISCAPLLRFEWRHKGGEWHEVQTRLVGAYNMLNMLAAATVGLHFGVSEIDICNALAGYTPSNNRSQLEETGHNHLIVDAYNANPTSMKAALENFRDMQVERKLAILGDMRELGSVSGEEHQRVVDFLVNAGIDNVWLVGEEFMKTDCKYRKFKNVDEVKEHLKTNRPEGCYILIKGSNGTKLFELPQLL